MEKEIDYRWVYNRLAVLEEDIRNIDSNLLLWGDELSLRKRAKMQKERADALAEIAEHLTDLSELSAYQERGSMQAGKHPVKDLTLVQSMAESARKRTVKKRARSGGGMATPQMRGRILELLADIAGHIEQQDPFLLEAVDVFFEAVMRAERDDDWEDNVLEAGQLLLRQIAKFIPPNNEIVRIFGFLSDMPEESASRHVFSEWGDEPAFGRWQNGSLPSGLDRIMYEHLVATAIEIKTFIVRTVNGIKKSLERLINSVRHTTSSENYAKIAILLREQYNALLENNMVEEAVEAAKGR